eukprot:scaffold488684_cov29-Prasinocladus_malaysianus.AAC.1
MPETSNGASTDRPGPTPSAAREILQLSERWEGRGKEVASLVGLLNPTQPAANLFVYGGQSTGKTSVVRCTCPLLINLVSNGIESLPYLFEDLWHCFNDWMCVKLLIASRVKQQQPVNTMNEDHP